MIWFSEELKIIFLSYLLSPIYPVPKTVLQIKYCITEVVILCTYFLRDQTHHMIVIINQSFVYRFAIV